MGSEGDRECGCIPVASRPGDLLMMPMQMPEDQMRALCERVHETVMKDCAEATPPNLDEEERLCKQVQFVTHMRYFLSDATTIMNEKLLRFDGNAVAGYKYDDTMRSARRYAFCLATVLDPDNVVTEYDFCVFALEALATKTHGFFGCCVRSLFATDTFSAYFPTGLQDPAVWMLLRAVCSSDSFMAWSVVERIQKQVPSALAAVGFMMLLVRTPFATDVLTVGYVDECGLTPCFAAMLNAVDPYKQRTPVDIVMATQSGSSDFSQPVCVCAQFRHMVDVWLGHSRMDTASSSDHGRMHGGTEEGRTESIYRFSRAERYTHAPEWTAISMHASAELEIKTGASEDDAAGIADAWSNAWFNTHNVMLMSKRIVTRRCCTAAVVLWFYHNGILYCVARHLRSMPSDQVSLDTWARECSDAFEQACRDAMGLAGVLPHLPVAKESRRAALDMPQSLQRWECAPVPGDGATAAVVGAFLKARSLPDGKGLVCVGQGAFRHSSAVAVISYKAF